MNVVLWGVSGCGKTTVGRLLAEALGKEFRDADDFHPESNREKMRAGNPLTDDDRWPWLQRLAEMLADETAAGGGIVLACSALKYRYREILAVDDNVTFVLLDGDFDLIARRLAERNHEFMNNSLLQSQFDTLERVGDELKVEISANPGDVCKAIQERLEENKLAQNKLEKK